jgi:hypothetical protein
MKVDISIWRSASLKERVKLKVLLLRLSEIDRASFCSSMVELLVDVAKCFPADDAARPGKRTINWLGSERVADAREREWLGFARAQLERAANGSILEERAAASATIALVEIFLWREREQVRLAQFANRSKAAKLTWQRRQERKAKRENVERK